MFKQLSLIMAFFTFCQALHANPLAKFRAFANPYAGTKYTNCSALLSTIIDSKITMSYDDALTQLGRVAEASKKNGDHKLNRLATSIIESKGNWASFITIKGLDNIDAFLVQAKQKQFEIEAVATNRANDRGKKADSKLDVFPELKSRVLLNQATMTVTTFLNLVSLLSILRGGDFSNYGSMIVLGLLLSDIPFHLWRIKDRSVDNISELINSKELSAYSRTFDFSESASILLSSTIVGQPAPQLVLQREAVQQTTPLWFRFLGDPKGVFSSGQKQKMRLSAIYSPKDAQNPEEVLVLVFQKD